MALPSFTCKDLHVTPRVASRVPAFILLPLFSGAKVPIVVLIIVNAACVAVLIGSADGDVLATFPNPRDVGVIAETEAEVARVAIYVLRLAITPAIYVLTLLKPSNVAELIGNPDGDVLATFPSPRYVGVIAETEAAVASVGIVAAKDVPEAPYIKSLLLTLP